MEGIKLEVKYYLHKLVKNTNIDHPMSNNIDYTEFPTQDSTKINTTTELEYVDEKFLPIFSEDTNLHDDEDRVFKKQFTYIRSDDSSYDDSKEVLLSKDCKDVIIHYKGKCLVDYSAPENYKYLVGMRVYPEYTDGTREAYIFSTQGLETGILTVIEYYDDNTYRIILDTEVFMEYNPDDIVIDDMVEPDTASIRKSLIEGRVAIS